MRERIHKIMDQNKIETLGPTGEIIEPTDLLCFVEEKDEIRIWTNKVNAVLKDLRPKLAINNCTPTTFHYYLGTFRKLVLFLQDGQILKRMVEGDKYTVNSLYMCS